MRTGNVHKFGDVILATLQFTDTTEMKTRPAVVLFEELGNIVVAGITSNTMMQGIPLLTKEGAIKDSIIKTNYIFTIDNTLVKKKLFALSLEKRNILRENIVAKLQA